MITFGTLPFLNGYKLCMSRVKRPRSEQSTSHSPHFDSLLRRPKHTVVPCQWARGADVSLGKVRWGWVKTYDITWNYHILGNEGLFTNHFRGKKGPNVLTHSHIPRSWCELQCYVGNIPGNCNQNTFPGALPRRYYFHDVRCVHRIVQYTMIC